MLIRENPADESINKCGSYGRIRFSDIKNLLPHEVGDINSWLVKHNLFVDKVVNVEEDIEETKRLQSILEKITLEKTTISSKRLKEVYEKKQDWYMSAEEALSLGVVDEILK
jgi:hypothetical protein